MHAVWLVFIDGASVEACAGVDSGCQAFPHSSTNATLFAVLAFIYGMMQVRLQMHACADDCRSV